MNRPTDLQDHDFIPFARPSIGHEEEKAVLEVLRSGWLTTAEQTRKFEEEFAAFTGAPYALAVNSATAGLHLALEALGIGPGDKVLTTPYTFTSTAEVVRYLNADPVFIDIDPASLTIDPRGIEEALQRDSTIKAIIPVHIAGYPCDVEGINSTAGRYGVRVVEDAAHAFPIRVNGKFLGTGSDLGVYSFYATKTITTGEGGMVVTSDSSLAERIARMRLHGIDREVWRRYTSSNASWKYDVVAPGYKYNLPDIAAAIGRVQLKRSEMLLNRRRRIAETYLDSLAGYDFLRLPPHHENHAWHLFIIRLVPEALNIERDEFIEELQARGIGVSVHFIPLHMMTYYKEKYGYKAEDFPNSLEAYQTAISLPIYPDMRDDQIQRVIETVISIGTAHYRGAYNGR